MMRKALHVVVLLLLAVPLITGCQPAATTPTAGVEPVRTAQATRPLVLTETAAAPPPQPLSTLTSASSPDLLTPTDLPAATATPNPLAFHPRQRWLAYQSIANTFAVVNQDGSGLTHLTDLSVNAQGGKLCDTGHFAEMVESPLNRMVKMDGSLYIIQPPDALRVIHLSSDDCAEIAFTGDNQTGMLAMIQRATADAIPELVIYELPSGKLRDRFPLVRCSVGIECTYQDAIGWQVRWSPNGRYLAFPAMWASPSTDLYVYDTLTRSSRQLASSADSVSQLWWSPGGSWVIMGETPELTFYGATSLWAVSIQGNDVRQIGAIASSLPQGILGWVDPDQFIAYDGFTGSPNEVAQNLRLINLAGQTQMLFDGAFVEAAIDDTRKVVAIYVLSQDNYEQGTYLISVADPTPRFLTPSQVTWDDDLKLFMPPDYLDLPPCEGDPEARQAFDRSGNPRCVPPPEPPVTYPAPNFRWQVSLQDGVSVIAAASGARLSISPAPASQVIWCPDSSCFFFVAVHQLYRVSIPDLTARPVDGQLPPEREAIDFYWVE